MAATTYLIYTDTDEVKGWSRKRISSALKKEMEFGHGIHCHGGYIVMSNEKIRGIPATRVICCDMSLDRLTEALGESEIPYENISIHRNGYDRHK